MLEIIFLLLSFMNSLFLITIFIVRKRLNWAGVKKIGYGYFCLGPLAIYAMILVIREQQDSAYNVFLLVFLCYLAMEILLDHVLKIEFRMLKRWYLLVPYLVLYYAMNYGFMVMSWKIHVVWGILLLGLFILQIVTNAKSHSPLKNSHNSLSI